jgi:adenylyl-sulfate reductase (glutathione)
VKKADGTTEQRKADRDLWIDGSAVQSLDRAAAEKLAGGARDKDTLLVLYAPWCPFCQVGCCSGSANTAQQT